eukprot:1001078-Rhodomonas_salina.1
MAVGRLVGSGRLVPGMAVGSYRHILPLRLAPFPLSVPKNVAKHPTSPQPRSTTPDLSTVHCLVASYARSIPDSA